MLHFHPVNLSLDDTSSLSGPSFIPPAWRSLLTFTPFSPISSLSAAQRPLSTHPTLGAASNIAQTAETYERLVGMEFLGSRRMPVLDASRRGSGHSIGSTARMTNASFSTSDAQLTGAQGEDEEDVYFFILLVASCNGKDTSIEAVRCAFRESDGEEIEEEEEEEKDESEKEEEKDMKILSERYYAKDNKADHYSCAKEDSPSVKGDIKRHAKEKRTELHRESVQETNETLHDMVDRYPDLLLEHLWNRFRTHLVRSRSDSDNSGDDMGSPVEPYAHLSPQDAFIPNTSSTTPHAGQSQSSLTIFERVPLLLHAGVVDVVQASLTTCESELDVSNDLTKHAYSPTSTMFASPKPMREGEVGECAMLSFTERLDTETATRAMPKEKGQSRRSFASLRRFVERERQIRQRQQPKHQEEEKEEEVLSRLQKERVGDYETDRSPSGVRRHSISPRSHPVTSPLTSTLATGTSMTTSVTQPNAVSSEVLPYRYFVWLHVVGTDVFLEATVTERVTVPLSSFTRPQNNTPTSATMDPTLGAAWRSKSPIPTDPIRSTQPSFTSGPKMMETPFQSADREEELHGKSHPTRLWDRKHIPAEQQPDSYHEETKTYEGDITNDMDATHTLLQPPITPLNKKHHPCNANTDAEAATTTSENREPGTSPYTPEVTSSRSVTPEVSSLPMSAAAPVNETAATVVVPANAFCQSGYFLQRRCAKKSDHHNGFFFRDKKIKTNFYWISACDFSLYGLQVKEVTYHEDMATATNQSARPHYISKGNTRNRNDGVSLANSATHSASSLVPFSLHPSRNDAPSARGEKGGKCTQSEGVSSAVTTRLGRLSVRSAAQWSLAQYPRWHHWDPVTQRLSFWAAFRTYDKLRIVAFDGHPDRRRCEFERNLARRTRPLESVVKNAFSVFSTPVTVPTGGLMLERGFGVPSPVSPPYLSTANVTSAPFAFQEASGSAVLGVDNMEGNDHSAGNHANNATIGSHGGVGEGGEGSCGLPLTEPWGSACSSSALRQHMCVLPFCYEDDVVDLVLCEQLFFTPPPVNPGTTSTTKTTLGATTQFNTHAKKYGATDRPVSSMAVSSSTFVPTPSFFRASPTTNRTQPPPGIRFSGEMEDSCLRWPKNGVGAETDRELFSPLAIWMTSSSPPSSMGPPAILCNVTALRNYADTVQLTIPLLPEERLRITYSTRVSFLRMRGMIAIYLPGVFVHYIDLHHKDAPPRHLFGVRLSPTKEEMVCPSIPLISTLPTPTGQWLYVPGTCMLFEAHLQLSSVWRYIQRRLKRRRSLRMLACGAPSVDAVIKEMESDVDEMLWREPCCLPPPYPLPHPAVFAEGLDPSPLHNALHVALTHFHTTPQQCAFYAARRDTVAPSVSTSMPRLHGHFYGTPISASLMEWETLWSARDGKLKNVFRTFLRSSSIRSEMSVEFIASLLIGEAYERTRSVCRWQPSPVTTGNNNKNSSNHMNPANNDASSNTTFSTTMNPSRRHECALPLNMTNACGPYYAALPLWDTSGMASTESQFRYETIRYYAAWQSYQRNTSLESGNSPLPMMCSSAPPSFLTPGMSPMSPLRQEEEQEQQQQPCHPSHHAAGEISFPVVESGVHKKKTEVSRDLSYHFTRDVSPPVETVAQSSNDNMGSNNNSNNNNVTLRSAEPSFFNVTNINSTTATTNSTAFRFDMDVERNDAVLSALLVHAWSQRDVMVSRQQCHNTIPEWWLCRGVVSSIAGRSHLPMRAAPHTRLLFTSNGNTRDDAGSSSATRTAAALLQRLKGAFISNSGNGSSHQNRSSNGQIMGPSVTPLARVALPFTVSSTAHVLHPSTGGIGLDSPHPSGDVGGSVPSMSLHMEYGTIPSSTESTPHLQPMTPELKRHVHGGGTLVPFDGPSCGTSFVEELIDQLKRAVWPPNQNHSNNNNNNNNNNNKGKSCSSTTHASSGVGATPLQSPGASSTIPSTSSCSQPSSQQQQQQQQQQRRQERQVRSRHGAQTSSSRFLTPASASSFASWFLSTPTSKAGVAAHLTLTATLYDAAMASIVHSLVRIIKATAADTEDLVRLDFLYRLALALERIGVPPSVDLMASLATEGVQQLPSPILLRAQQCQAPAGDVDISLILHHIPSLGSILQQHVMSFAPHQSRDMGISTCAVSSCHYSMQDIITPAEEEAMLLAIRESLQLFDGHTYSDSVNAVDSDHAPHQKETGVSSRGTTTSATTTTTATATTTRTVNARLDRRGRGGYMDVNSSVLSMDSSLLPEQQERMRMCNLILHASPAATSPQIPPFSLSSTFSHQSPNLCVSVGSGSFHVSAVNLANAMARGSIPAAPLREQKWHILAALDPAPFLQRADARCIPCSTEYASPFPPFQLWWRQRRRLAQSRSPFSTSPFPPTFSVSERFVGGASLAPTRLDDATGTVVTHHEEREGKVMVGLNEETQKKCDAPPKRDHDNNRKGLGMNPALVEENLSCNEDVTIRCLPQLLASTSLGFTVSKERAKAAMAVALDPFFKND